MSPLDDPDATAAIKNMAAILGDPDNRGGRPPGTVLDGRYLLGGQLGRGGTADVYRATDQLLGREVAVKVLRIEDTSLADRERFLGEARTLATLSHPGIVGVLDAGTEHEHPYLVMELVIGPTLGEAATSGELSQSRVAQIGAELAEALACAHRHGVVHRDVKPGNVLLGVDGRVRLADFGIARLVGQHARHTQTGFLVGTAAYLSPEQVSGAPITSASDVYSLGLVLLEALTGTRPYTGTSIEIALARLSRQPDIPPGLAPGWRRLLQQMTARDPRRRPTASAVAAALRGADETRPFTMPARASLPAPGWRRAVARMPVQARVLAVAATALVVLLTCAALTPSGDRGDQRPLSSAPTAAVKDLASASTPSSPVRASARASASPAVATTTIARHHSTRAHIRHARHGHRAHPSHKVAKAPKAKHKRGKHH